MASPVSFAAFALLLIGTILIAAAAATPAWSTYDYKNPLTGDNQSIQAGPYKLCNKNNDNDSSDCSSLSTSDVNDWCNTDINNPGAGVASTRCSKSQQQLQAVRILTLISVLTSGVTAILTLVAVMGNYVRMSVLMVVGCLVSGIAGLVATVIWPEFIKTWLTTDLSDPPSTDYGYSYGIFITGWILCVLSTLCICRYNFKSTESAASTPLLH